MAFVHIALTLQDMQTKYFGLACDPCGVSSLAVRGGYVLSGGAFTK
jgi:hypothetical protein